MNETEIRKEVEFRTGLATIGGHARASSGGLITVRETYPTGLILDGKPLGGALEQYVTLGAFCGYTLALEQFANDVIAPLRNRCPAAFAIGVIHCMRLAARVFPPDYDPDWRKILGVGPRKHPATHPDPYARWREVFRDPSSTPNATP